MKARPSVLVDLDNVYYATNIALLKEVQKKYKLGLNLKLSNIEKLELEDCIPGLTFTQLEGIFKEPAFWDNVPPLVGAPEFLEELSEVCDIHIVTDRRWYPELKEQTVSRLVKAKVPFKEVHICKGKEKHLWAKERKVLAAVEDNLNNAILLKDVCPTFLLDWPHNQFEEIENIYRHADYYSLVCAIKELAQDKNCLQNKK